MIKMKIVIVCKASYAVFVYGQKARQHVCVDWTDHQTYYTL